MTDKERREFCVTLMGAAHKLRIFCRIENDHVVWFDPQTNRAWRSEPAQTKENIILNACKSLQDYLCLPTTSKSAPSNSTSTGSSSS